MRVVANIGGSVLSPSKGSKRFREYSKAISALIQQHEVYIVVGGGKAARDFIRIGRSLGTNEAVCDMIGIETTRLNARLLIAALGKNAYPEPPLDYQEAETAMALNNVVVMGGVTPGQSTDAVAAILAEYVDADELIFATRVKGIYEKDPEKFEEADLIEEMAPSELVELVMRSETKAGSKSPVDPLAAKIIERSRIYSKVISGKDPWNLVDAVNGKDVGGTIIRK